MCGREFVDQGFGGNVVLGVLRHMKKTFCSCDNPMKISHNTTSSEIKICRPIRVEGSCISGMICLGEQSLLCRQTHSRWEV